MTGGRRSTVAIRRDVVPAIRARHLWQRFGSRDVLRDVSFDVYPGEIFGFIGPNGAGKTTTIRIVATLVEPLSGRVEIDGLDVSMDPETVRRRIGYMSDQAGVYQRITVREFLEFFAAAYAIPSLGVVATVMELTDISPLVDQLVATLSKGQKQRLQLARILLHDPKVLILDEPASDLDPRARFELRELLLDLQSLGKTILLSSHILSELSDVCTSVGIIEQGQMVVVGPIEEIAERLAERTASHGSGQALVAGASGGLGSLAGSGSGSSWSAGSETVTSQRRLVKLRVLGDLTAAAYAIHGGPGICDVSVVGGLLHVGHEGGDQRVAELVAHLVYRGFGVVGVADEYSALERVFFEATAGSNVQGGL